MCMRACVYEVLHRPQFFFLFCLYFYIHAHMCVYITFLLTEKKKKKKKEELSFAFPFRFVLLNFALCFTYHRCGFTAFPRELRTL